MSGEGRDDSSASGSFGASNLRRPLSAGESERPAVAARPKAAVESAEQHPASPTLTVYGAAVGTALAPRLDATERGRRHQ